MIKGKGSDKSFDPISMLKKGFRFRFLNHESNDPNTLFTNPIGQLLTKSHPLGSIGKIPRKHPLLHEGAVPCFLPGCLKYLSVPESSHLCKRLRYESKENSNR